MKIPEISLLQWQERYGTEKACASTLAKIRWPNGFMCPRCSHERAYYISKKSEDSLPEVTIGDLCPCEKRHDLCSAIHLDNLRAQIF